MPDFSFNLEIIKSKKNAVLGEEDAVIVICKKNSTKDDLFVRRMKIDTLRAWLEMLKKKELESEQISLPTKIGLIRAIV